MRRPACAESRWELSAGVPATSSARPRPANRVRDGIHEGAFVDIDSLRRPGLRVRQAGRLVRPYRDRQQTGTTPLLSPLVTTISAHKVSRDIGISPPAGTTLLMAVVRKAVPGDRLDPAADRTRRARRAEASMGTPRRSAPPKPLRREHDGPRDAAYGCRLPV